LRRTAARCRRRRWDAPAIAFTISAGFPQLPLMTAAWIAPPLSWRVAGSSTHRIAQA
jgi:hypothetical protein